MDKVCPVVLRDGDAILAFRHPLAGLQLVKGSAEPGETIAAAAIRELREESGLLVQATRDLGLSRDIVAGQTWHFWLMETPATPENWTHACADDGGHVFAFFWQPLNEPLPDGFAPPFRKAIAHVRDAVGHS